MNDVTRGEGRTILFVSHNMTVKELCSKGILLNQGQIDYQGNILNTIIEYQKSSARDSSYTYNGNLDEAIGNENIRIKEFSASPVKGDLIDIDSGVRVKLVFQNYCPDITLDTTFELKNYEELVIFHVGKLITQNNDSKVGEYTVEFDIPAGLLNAGNYYFKLYFGKDQRILLFGIDEFIGFEVENVKVGTVMYVYPGVTRPIFEYKVQTP